MASNNGIIQEIQRYIRRPKITFEKGIIRSDNDSVLGYVSDIKNMDIDKGVAKRRAGSKSLNDPDISIKYKKLFWVNISGCDILFGITEQLELVAYVDRWLEVQFKVYKKGLSKIRYQNSADSFQVKWDQGNEFFVMEDNSSVKIVNDFGQIYKIEKRGYIGLMKSKDAAFTYDTIDDNKPLKMLEESRYYTDSEFPASATEYGLFVNIVDATNKQPENFYLIPETSIDTDRTIYPIDGAVRVASVNEAGEISKFSEPVLIDQEDSYFVSRIPAFSESSNYNFLMASDTDAVPGTDVVVRGIANDTTAEVNGAYSYFAQTSFTRPAYDNYKGKLLVKSVNDKLEYYIYFDASGKSLALATTNLNKFFIFNIEKRFDPYPLDNETIATGKIREQYYTSYFVPNVIAEVESYETSKATPSEYTTYDSVNSLAYVELTASADVTTTVIKLRNSSQLNSMVGKVFSQSGFKRSDSINGAEKILPMKIILASAATFHEDIVDLFEIEVKVDSANANVEGVLCYKSKYYSDNVQKEYNALLQDLGYDCWDLIRTDGNLAISSVNLYSGKVGTTEDRPIMANYEDYLDFFLNGDRFAVWNNDEIIAISQRGFTNDGTNFIYENDQTLYSSPLFTEPCISQTFSESISGDVTGVTYGDGKATFDGSSYISYEGTDAYEFGAKWTIIAILKQTNADNPGFVISKNSSPTSFGINMVLDGGDLIVNDGGGTPVSFGQSISLNTEYFTVIVHDTDEDYDGGGENAFSFVNGNVEYGTLAVDSTNNSNEIYVGSDGAGSNKFIGEIYTVMAFPVAFTEAQITSIYNSGDYQAWFLNEFQDNNYGYAYNQPTLTRLDYAYSPVCAPVFKTLRSFPYKIDPFEDIITSPDHVVNNNGRLYCIQGRRLWGGSYRTMKLTTPKDLDYDVYRMERFFDGVILFTNKGIYRVDARYNISEVNTSAISTGIIKASTYGNGMVYGITENNEVFYIMIIVENNSTPYAKSVLISQAVHNLDWTASPDMEFIEDTLWIARDNDVWGYYEGGWKKRYEWEDKIIDHIANYKNHLCISFLDKDTIGLYDLVDIDYNVPIVVETV